MFPFFFIIYAMNTKKIIIHIIYIIVILLIGFFIGRCTTNDKVKIETEYIQLPPIHDTITDIRPSYIEIPADTAHIIQYCIDKGLYSELFPYKEITDTIYTSRDTSQILYDWATTRAYSETLFDIDTIGRCDVDILVRFNRLDSVSYTYIPMERRTTLTRQKTRLFSPFIGIGASTSIYPSGEVGKHASADIDIGLFIKEKYGVGFEYQYEVLNGSHNVGGMFYYKF